MTGRVVLAIVVAAAVSGCGNSGNPAAEKAAVAAAEAWLALVDQGKYAESWDETAAFFKGAVAREKWQQQMESFRKPFGAKVSREVKAAKYRTELPGAPDGEYVVVQFAASFEHKRSAVETVTPMLQKDGKWRISGYYIK